MICKDCAEDADNGVSEHCCEDDGCSCQHRPQTGENYSE